MCDSAFDVSESDCEDLDDHITQLTRLPANSRLTSVSQTRIHRDPNGQPIVRPDLKDSKDSMRFTKVTKKKSQLIRLYLDESLKKILWHFEGQNSKKEIFIDDVTEVRTGKIAQTHIEELGQPEDVVDRWLTIVYYNPESRGRGRSTHAIHLIAADSSFCKPLKDILSILMQDRRDMMAGVSGNVDDDRSLSRFWMDTIKQKFNNDVPVDVEAQILGRDDMRRCCHRCLIYMPEIDFNNHFDHADVQRRGVLGKAEFLQFFRSVHRRPHVETIFREYSSLASDTMSRSDFFRFLKRSQGVPTEDQANDCETLFNKYADAHNALESVSSGDGDSSTLNAMSLTAFKRFFLDDNAPLPDPQATPVLDRPLNEYFISSSHNTYLVGWQVNGQSSTEPYVDCLKQGCRCVEIDCWDGDDGEPQVTHGHTHTSCISFVSIIKAIKLWAFRVSKYPLIISLEVHCGPAQQRRMAEIMIKHLSQWLLQRPIVSKNGALPTPEELKERILIKVKEPMQPPIASATSAPIGNSHRRTRSKSEADAMAGPPRFVPQTAAERRIAPIIIGSAILDDRAKRHPLAIATTTSSDDTESDDENRNEARKQPKTSKIVPELGNLGVYTRGIKFSDFKSQQSKKPNHVYSFNENTFKNKCVTPQMRDQVEKHNRDYLMRVYPKGSRIKSDNFDPLQFWRHGVQMVATNWQTYDLGTEINDAMFASGHDRTGYVLKPKNMRPRGEETAVEVLSESRKKTCKFSVTIISARHLTPPPGTNVINPYIEVEIFSADNPARGLATVEGGGDASAKGGVFGIGKPMRRWTNIVQGNGWNPSFNEHIELTLETDYPSLVFVRFLAWSSPDGKRESDQKEPLCAHTAKLSSLQQGYRLLHLRDRRGDNTVSKLLVNIQKGDGRASDTKVKNSREYTPPESPRASEENIRPGGRRFMGKLFSRTPSERRRQPASEPTSGYISRTISTERS